ncbi:MAG: hypothetical protein HY225_02980 [Candidatus Vogelbacteria bacterium]|nr:hypothetical protein [Candidatus Vogelbacteria bacterium]
MFTPLMFKLLGPICFLICLYDPLHDLSGVYNYDGPFRRYQYKDVPYSIGEFFHWSLPFGVLIVWILFMIYKAFAW